VSQRSPAWPWASPSMARQALRLVYGVLAEADDLLDVASRPTLLAAVLTASVYLIVRGSTASWWGGRHGRRGRSRTFASTSELSAEPDRAAAFSPSPAGLSRKPWRGRPRRLIFHVKDLRGRGDGKRLGASQRPPNAAPAGRRQPARQGVLNRSTPRAPLRATHPAACRSGEPDAPAASVPPDRRCNAPTPGKTWTLLRRSTTAGRACLARTDGPPIPWPGRPSSGFRKAPNPGHTPSRNSSGPARRHGRDRPRRRSGALAAHRVYQCPGMRPPPTLGAQ